MFHRDAVLSVLEDRNGEIFSRIQLQIESDRRQICNKGHLIIQIRRRSQEINSVIFD